MIRFIRPIWIFCCWLLISSQHCFAEELQLEHHCATNLTNTPETANSWQPGIGTVHPNEPCWVRIKGHFINGQLLTFSLPGIDLRLFDNKGRQVALSSKFAGHQAILLHAGQVAFQPEIGFRTYYAHLSVPEGMVLYRYPAIATADSVQFSVDNGKYETVIAMQTAVLCTFAFVAFIFWLLLQKPDYGWFFMMTILNAAFIFYSSGMIHTHFNLSATTVNLIVLGSWFSNYFHGLILLSLFRPLRSANKKQYLFLQGSNLLYLLTAAFFLIDINTTYILNAFTQSLWYLAIVFLTYQTLKQRSWVTLIALLGMLPAVLFYWPDHILWSSLKLLNWSLTWSNLDTLVQFKQQLHLAYDWLYFAMPQGAIWDCIQQLFFPAMFSCSLVFHAYRLNRAVVLSARTDALTGLPNRNRLAQLSQQFLQGEHGPDGLVIALNIERFHSINQTLGYDVGDQVLIYVAGKLRQLHYAICGRSHGDHFFLVLFGQAKKDALRQDLFQLFSRPAELSGQVIDTVISAGVALLSHDVNHSFLRAELALDSARIKKSRWAEFLPEMLRDRVSDLSILSDLRHAIEENQLQMHLQPKFLLADKSCHSAEALIRWLHPTKGMIPPADFIPFAESTGHITELTRWMLRQAAQFVATQRRNGMPVQIAVNLSAIDLQSPVLVSNLKTLLEETGAHTSDLRLEITESAAMSDTRRAEECLLQLSELGFSLSIDDFGTGYSSLAYLQKLAVNEIKIDRLFIKGCYQNEKSQALLRSMVIMARALKLEVVTEGVETEAELTFIQQLGADTAQGFLLAKPMTAIQFTEFYQHKINCQQHGESYE